MTTELSYDDYLAHYGIKGMRWGVRRKPGPDGTIGSGSGKTKTNKSKMSDESKDEITSEEEEKKALRKKRAKQVAIGTGVLVAAAGGAYLAKKAGLFEQKKVSEIKTEPKEEVKRVVDKMTNVAHLSRGKDYGFRVIQSGGSSDAVSSADSVFGEDASGSSMPGNFEKKEGHVLSTFLDPEGRKDRAGRVIPHTVVVPPSQSSGLNSSKDVQDKIWPKLKDNYPYTKADYDSMLGEGRVYNPWK